MRIARRADRRIDTSLEVALGQQAGRNDKQGTQPSSGRPANN
jgi:hypothetical protein